MQQQMTHRMVQNMRMLPSAAPMASAAAILYLIPLTREQWGDLMIRLKLYMTVLLTKY